MNKKYIEKFGQHLKKLREAKGFTQEELAVDAEISRSTIGMIESAQNDITLSKLKSIADALGIKVSMLLDFEE